MDTALIIIDIVVCISAGYIIGRAGERANVRAQARDAQSLILSLVHDCRESSCQHCRYKDNSIKPAQCRVEHVLHELADLSGKEGN